MDEPKSGQEHITTLLGGLRQGNASARDQLAEIVYPELKRIAQIQMRSERPNHTLQPTALVNEVFVRIVANEKIQWEDRGHFFSLAAQLMRQILVDHARRRRADKRGGGAFAVELEDWHARFHEDPERILEVDRLLQRLCSIDPRQAAVVEMRYFLGLSEAEIGEVLNISERTVKRDWSMARAWLRRELAR